jgi:hypothetical protein
VLATREGGALVLDPGGERLEVQRLLGPAAGGPVIEGLPFDDEGLILVPTTLWSRCSKGCVLRASTAPVVA